jgi:hypothetical protein
VLLDQGLRLLKLTKSHLWNMHTNVKKTYLQFTRIQMKTCTQMWKKLTYNLQESKWKHAHKCEKNSLTIYKNPNPKHAHKCVKNSLTIYKNPNPKQRQQTKPIFSTCFRISKHEKLDSKITLQG